MGRIPVSLNNTQYQNNPRPADLPSGFGMAPLEAAAKRGQAIAALGGQVLDVATDYAIKNKKADMQADALAAESQRKNIWQQAQMDAGQTDDPAKIRQIWQDAHTRYSGWLSEKSDKGVPNIRWRDQQKGMLAEADALGTEFKTAGELRIAEVGRRNSNAKAVAAQTEAEMAGDRERIVQAVQVRVENGTLTREEGAVERAAAFTRSDLVVAKNNIAGIESMEPDKAAAAAQLFEQGLTAKEKDGSWSAFEHIPEGERSRLVQQAQAAAERSRRRAEGEELDRLNMAFFEETLPEDMTKDYLEKNFPNLAPEVKARWLTAKRSQKEPLTIERINEAFKLVADAKADKASGIMVNTQLRAMGFNTESAPALFDAWKEKYDPQTAESFGSYTNEKSISKARITDVLVTENERGWGRRLNVGKGGKKKPTEDKLSEFNGVLAKELDFYETFTKEQMAKGKSWPEADAAYWDLPKVKALTDQKDIEGYLQKAREAVAPPSAKNPDEVPVSGKKPAQVSNVQKPSVEDTLRLDFLNNWSE